MKLDRKYLAGLIDGEGCFGIDKRLRGKRWICLTPNFQFSNTHKEIVEDLKDTFGIGTINLSKHPNRPNYKPCWNYRVNGFAVKKVIKYVLPYLRIKKEQAELVLKFIEIREKEWKKRKPYSPILFEIQRKVSLLNRRGVKPMSDPNNRNREIL